MARYSASLCLLCVGSLSAIVSRQDEIIPCQRAFAFGAYVCQLCEELEVSRLVYEGSYNVKTRIDTRFSYRSPSENHPSLGISLRKVNKRHTPEKRFTASQLNFTHGVASGDPYPDSVILWTRASPMFADVNSNATDSGYVPLYYHGPKQVSTAPVCVEFKVARTADFAVVESSGTAYTSSDIDVSWPLLAQVWPILALTLWDGLVHRQGRGQQPDCLHPLLLPVQHLRLECHQPSRPYQDHPSRHRLCC